MIANFSLIHCSVFSLVLEVTEEVSPHYVCLKRKKGRNKINITYLINIRTLCLTHLNKMINEQFSIISSNSSSLFKTLVSIKCKLFSLYFNFFRFILQHICKSSFFVLNKFIVFLFKFLLPIVSEITPFTKVSLFKQLFFFIIQCFFLFDKSSFNFFSVF